MPCGRSAPVPGGKRWKEIAKIFYEKCHVPNCIGNVDGIHCRLKYPACAGSLFHNRKGHLYLVIIAVADPNHYNYLQGDKVFVFVDPT